MYDQVCLIFGTAKIREFVVKQLIGAHVVWPLRSRVAYIFGVCFKFVNLIDGSVL